MRLFTRKPRKAEIKTTSSSLFRFDEDDNSSINDRSLFTDAGRTNADYNVDDTSLCTKHTTISQEFARIRGRNHPTSPATSRKSTIEAFDTNVPNFSQKAAKQKPDSHSTPASTNTSRSSPPSSAKSFAEARSNNSVQASKSSAESRDGPRSLGSENLELHEGFRPTIFMEDRMGHNRLGASPRSREPMLLWQEKLVPSPVMSFTGVPFELDNGDGDYDDDDDNNHDDGNNNSFPLHYSIDSDDEIPLNSCEVQKGVLDDSVDEEVGWQLNYDDDNLMRASSPGALRLTQDGLEKLDEMAFLDDTTLSLEERSMGLDSWKELQQRRKLLRNRLEERDRKLQRRIKDGHSDHSDHFVPLCMQEETDYQIEVKVLKNGKKQKRLRRPPPKQMTTLQKLGLVSCAEKKRPKSKKADVCGMSLAPMNTLDEEDLQWSSTKKNSPLVSNPMKKKGKPVTKDGLLAIERQRHMESQQEKEESELKEKKRIARMRASYLERQRALEAKAPLPQRPVTLWVNSLNNVECANGRATPDVSVVENDFSTGSTDVSSLPCVVCALTPRTHIATPCMHYSLCEQCVALMGTTGSGGKSCPVCKDQATFTRVLF
jgi:hypothetical protein